MTTNHSRGRERHDRGTLLAGLIALTALAAAVLLAISLAPASAETPAERCKRETTAYNNAWKNSWAASHPGKKPSDAPRPPVPYKCGGNNQPPPSISPTTTTPNGKKGSEERTPEGAPNSPHEGPSSAAPTSRRDNQNGTEPGQPTIEGKADPSRQPTFSLPTSERGQNIVLSPLFRSANGTVRMERGSHLDRVVIDRQDQRSESVFEFAASIPRNSRWTSTKDGIELRNSSNKRIAFLSTTRDAKNPTTLRARGDKLILDFANSNRSVADIIGSSRRNASAHGCTWGRGNWGARACVDVQGDSNTVTRIGAGMDVGGMRWPTNICDREYEVSYYELGTRREQRYKQDGCSPASAGVTHWWFYRPDGRDFLILDDGSPVCARVRSSHTNGEWSPYACKTIKK